jgi:methionine-rich copper-binding protein CopC
MKPALALLLLALAAALAFSASPAYAQIELTEADPPDGALLDAPPDIVHLCFSQPVNVQDNTTFDFGYQMPDGRNLGLRIVFQPDGECVDVHPGLPDERPAGEYTFEWQVTAAEGDEEGSGTLRFQVSAGGTPVPPPSPTPAETPLPVTPSPEGDAGTGDADDDDGAEILGLSLIFALPLITAVVVGGAAVLFTLGYFLRRRIGYEPHRPPEGGEGGGDH